MCGIVTDFYVDLSKCRDGDDVRHRIPQLQRLVMNYGDATPQEEEEEGGEVGDDDGPPRSLLDFFGCWNGGRKTT